MLVILQQGWPCLLWTANEAEKLGEPISLSSYLLYDYIKLDAMQISMGLERDYHYR